MTDAAHYFEASTCLLCSFLSVMVEDRNVLIKYVSTYVQTAQHLGFSQPAALLSIGIVQQRYAFINMSIIRWLS